MSDFISGSFTMGLFVSCETFGTSGLDNFILAAIVFDLESCRLSALVFDSLIADFCIFSVIFRASLLGNFLLDSTSYDLEISRFAWQASDSFVDDFAIFCERFEA